MLYHNLTHLTGSTPKVFENQLSELGKGTAECKHTNFPFCLHNQASLLVRTDRKRKKKKNTLPRGPMGDIFLGLRDKIIKTDKLWFTRRSWLNSPISKKNHKPQLCFHSLKTGIDSSAAVYLQLIYGVLKEALNVHLINSFLTSQRVEEIPNLTIGGC